MRKLLKGFAVCGLFFVFCSAAFAQKGWFVEAGMPYINVSGGDLRIGVIDRGGGFSHRGVAVSIENESRAAIEVKTGYEFENESQLLLSFFQYEHTPSKSAFNNVGDKIYPTRLHPWYYPFLFNPDTVYGENKIKLEMWDLSYIFPFLKTETWQLKLLTGLRYADFRDNLLIRYLESGFRRGEVVKEHEAYAAGPRMGIEAKTKLFKKFGLYASSSFAILIGSASDYTWDDDNTSNSQWFRSNDSLRILPMVDAELGATYSILDNIVARIGYRASVWFNAITQYEGIDDVTNYFYVKNTFDLVMSGFNFSVTVYFG
jgi:hypothetical protein